MPFVDTFMKDGTQWTSDCVQIFRDRPFVSSLRAELMCLSSSGESIDL